MPSRILLPCELWHVLRLPERDVLVFLFVELFVVPLGENLKRGVELLYDHLFCWPVRKQLVSLRHVPRWLLLPLLVIDVLRLRWGEHPQMIILSLSCL